MSERYLFVMNFTPEPSEMPLKTILLKTDAFYPSVIPTTKLTEV